MLKVLSSSVLLRRKLQNLPSRIPSNRDFRSPLLRFFESSKLTNGNNLVQFGKAWFCSDSSDGSVKIVEIKAAEDAAEGDGAEEADSKSNSAIVSTNPRPEDHLTVVALPLPHRPLFPGFYMPISVRDPKLLAALVENRKRSVAYAGAFLLKDEPGVDPSLPSGSETEKSIYDLKGKELFKRLHEVGTLAQVSSIHGEQVVLIGHRRLRITEMVEEDPLTVKVDHLKDLPFDKDDDVIKATSFEVISTLRDVLKINPLWKDHVATYTQHIGDFNFPRIADFGAAICGANKILCQKVLEELDVLKRLKLTLELVKKEMELSKLQESIAKAIEEKVTGEHRRYLLSEQLKAIKKELGIETDDKTALSG
ncbi:uncharacterized protein A4U43_C07F12440 [Asparagus officinalis]|uniref:Lon N-terminal domain-containing protein n=2 Tax=Asparagus officinalis TaxID=4686 RepID=A0A5P1EER3_ASPOF|nr:uncharacterized protein A4U43_C07F12440 [Asparagus officinalis]